MVIQKRGQVWVETVTYTLIAFVMIGLVLAFVQPKIQEYKDKNIIEQSINVMKNIDQTVREVGESAIGNKRKIEVLLKEGSLEISPINKTIILTIEKSKYIYSEPGTSIQDGNLIISTINKGEYKKIELKLNYTGIYTFKYKNSTDSKTLTKSPNNYNLFILKKGEENYQIDISAP